MKSRHFDLLIWQQASELIEQAERIHRNLLQVIFATHYQSSHRHAGTWVPPVSVVETNQSWWVISALPGVQASQMETRIEGEELIIAGVRPLPTCCAEGNLKIWEIPLGRFERRLNLTPGVQFTMGETRFEDGLLIMELKKLI
jgi:HSP20 family molecular chaperone IbpA